MSYKNYTAKNVLRWGRNLFRYVLGCFNTPKNAERRPTFIKLEGYRNTFCGYYDRSPFRSGNSSHLLLHANSENPLINPKKGSKTDLFLYDWKKREIVMYIGSTYAWNWQQGSRLMWLSEDEVIFNVYQNGQYKSKRVNVLSGKEDIFPFPVQDACSSFFISLDYRTLAAYRPDYGYFMHNDVGVISPRLFKVHLPSGESEEIVSWDDIVDKVKGDVFRKARVNHVCLSPDESSFVFLFRYEEGVRTHHYLLHKDLQSGELKVLTQNVVVSHYCWIDNKSLVFWGGIGAVGGYYRFDLANSKIDLIMAVKDGHPNLLDSGVFITDSYADERQLRKLYEFNTRGEVKQIAQFKEFPPINITARSDLHPSISYDKKYIQVDVCPLLNRTVAVISL